MHCNSATEATRARKTFTSRRPPRSTIKQIIQPQRLIIGTHVLLLSRSVRIGRLVSIAVVELLIAILSRVLIGVEGPVVQSLRPSNQFPIESNRGRSNGPVSVSILDPRSVALSLPLFECDSTRVAEFLQLLLARCAALVATVRTNVGLDSFRTRRQ